YVEYLGKAAWPAGLSFHYPHPGASIAPVQVGLSVLALVAATFLALAFARRAPWMLVGWLFYLGTLVPVIGLVQVGGQALADRYTYVPLLGVAIAVVWTA